MFAKVMREYGLGFDQTLALTPRRFWFLLNQIPRLRAEELLLKLRLGQAERVENGFEQAESALERHIGEVHVWENAPRYIEGVDDGEEGPDPEFDREAFNRLRSRFAGQQI